jgi:hypothetical protein
LQCEPDPEITVPFNQRGAPRRSGASTLKALEHSSSLSPSDSAAPQYRQIRADIASALSAALQPW